jgi:rhodanese-related sulfurtransferase
MNLATHLYRMCTIAILGVVVGTAHSLFVPIRLTPEAPPPLPPLPSPQSPQQPAATPDGKATPAAAPVEASQPAPQAPSNSIDITLAQARDLYLRNIMFVDARSAAEFEQGHVEGAVHLPLDAFSGGSRPIALDALDPAQQIVIYCGGGDCHASHDVAIRLNAFGYKLCYVMKDGYPAWQSAGYETAAGGSQ